MSYLLLLWHVIRSGGWGLRWGGAEFDPQSLEFYMFGTVTHNFPYCDVSINYLKSHENISLQKQKSSDGWFLFMF